MGVGGVRGAGRIAGAWMFGAWMLGVGIFGAWAGGVWIDRGPAVSAREGAAGAAATTGGVIPGAAGGSAAVEASEVTGGVSATPSETGAVPSTVFGRGGRLRAQTRTPAATISPAPAAIQGRNEAVLRVDFTAVVAEGAAARETGAGAVTGFGVWGRGAGWCAGWGDVGATGAAAAGSGVTPRGAASGRFWGAREPLKNPPGIDPVRAPPLADGATRGVGAGADAA